MINFTDLYDEHIDGLFNFGTKFTCDRELIKDCIQDVFVKLYTKRGELESVGNIKSYLYVSLRNRINDEFRRNVHNVDEEVNDRHMQNLEYAEMDDFESKGQEAMNMNNVNIFFEKLSPRQRQIVTLYYIEQRKYDVICQIMGINYQSVRNLMHRSLLRLRSLAATAV
jgi:RNA polymerase sigma factor (sigma-70 family)